jgi:acyl-coenzyme A synthetase/AMP-(fatty) acid ligase
VGDFPTLERPAAAQSIHAADPGLAYVLFTSGSTGRPKGVAMGAQPLAHLMEFHAAHPRLGRPARTLRFTDVSGQNKMCSIVTERRKHNRTCIIPGIIPGRPLR